MVVWVTVKDLETQLSGLLTFPRKGQGADLLEEGVHSLEVEGCGYSCNVFQIEYEQK
jgi:hypothetical protein